ncbi:MULTISPECIES: biotin--[acetyl-CoA-carboxylase] ligase [unclassified Wenzhouxiangella]|uniref:biotin--[acetyl-CoA-carboxylase] ligase n=1 Tax=unclassified Wenzhouxiangella TaxID=2613841 RepID=UPI0011C02647|nr:MULTISPECIES: biotin--[acetyl-CoA-carboxylase] ligase [unclassified Wenzhouxiangella]
MKPGIHELYARLADGRLHNGATLAEELGITRAAVWKRMQTLRKMGLEISGTAGDGYRLPHAIDLLDQEVIRGHIESTGVHVDVAGAVDSTNARLMAAGSPHAHALVAEAQTAGRGRHGRGWQSPPGSGLYLSLAWHFESGLAGLAPLSLVVGVTVAATLQAASGAPVRVKWPNDLFVADAKLGGCLVELGGAAEGPCRAVIGIGINLFRTPAMDAVDQQATALEDHGRAIDRNALAAALIDALAIALADFDRNGFEDVRARWPDFDTLRDRPVRVIRGDGTETTGSARGVDRQGRLQVETDGETVAVASGEVSVRVR